MDLTQHVAYLAGALVRTIKQEMREESRHLRSHLFGLCAPLLVLD